MFRIGLDVGSTTLKCVVLNENNEIIYSNYQRHFAQIITKTKEMLEEISNKFPDQKEVSIKISGSAGMGFANTMDIPFVQEVYATRLAVKTLLPESDCVVELGGEDAKILFLDGVMEVRMNGSCAGGTGAFIDQMATLLNITPLEMNEYAKDSQKLYSIASRCGVFAKSDIQPLLNQGARKEDIAASIFLAVANQTIAGLAQGREIKGNVVYLGGPLTFFSKLRETFDEALHLKGIFPENSLYFVSMGTALYQDEKVFDMKQLIEDISNYKTSGGYSSLAPLFKDEKEYKEFSDRHGIDQEIETFPLVGKAYIGIDAGSTTLKAVVLGEDDKLVHTAYMSNKGSPVLLVKDFLVDLYTRFPGIEIGGLATTGYGEEIIKNAFQGDAGLVETMAHFRAAKKYNPEVDFIIDIGGQDIKCFKIRNQAIDNIFLNEACSSGCGSFLQTFAGALNQDIADFSKSGLFAPRPVDLGSRCTVFMNSSVKQAQKDGASVEDISAGLAISVVKNALYKVIRVANAESLGKHIVVQGGTFLNNAVLRAFEKELNIEVTRPLLSGLMGAYGAALYIKEKNIEKSNILTLEQLQEFKHVVKSVTCNRCTNHCKLTVNTFANNNIFIGGNRCEKPLQLKSKKEKYNMFDDKKRYLRKYENCSGTRETIGLPFALNMFELLPFWHTFFKELGFGVYVSPESTRDVYVKGQHTIPSDTVCYPAKLIHGHMEVLLEQQVDAIFYPCMSYNLKEGKSDNHYNCPVVAYYPEVVKANISAIDDIKYIHDYIGIHRKKDFPKKIQLILEREFGPFNKKEIEKACKKAYQEYDHFMQKIRDKGEKYLAIAKENNLPIIVLAGRPYHLDSEINHGIDNLVCDCGAVLICEDAISHKVDYVKTEVLNQWTYHARLYSSAKYIAQSNDPMINLVQLVSFGCGVDAITTDEVRHILEEKNKIYTQIKIDEITNLGAVKIRLRSLFAATGLED